jgi:glyoxylase-like metal-dependent hydrolase (beta-lactamase superfamily II)
MRALCVLALLASAQDAVGQQTRPATTADSIALSAELVKTGLYVIRGGGANSLIRFSPVGSILVDGKSPGSYRLLMSQVRKLSKFGDLPIRVLVLTSHRDDRTGTNPQFAAAGVPIVVQKNAKRHLEVSEQADAKLITFEREQRLRMGGIEAQLHNFGNAHTDADTVVYFTNLKVVALGELYTVAAPQPDYANGGSLAGWASALGEVLALDFDVSVPGTGPAVSRADVQAFKNKMDTLISRASSLVKAGVPKDRLLAQLDTGDLGWSLDLTDANLDRFYTEMSAKD